MIELQIKTKQKSLIDQFKTLCFSDRFNEKEVADLSTVYALQIRKLQRQLDTENAYNIKVKSLVLISDNSF